MAARTFDGSTIAVVGSTGALGSRITARLTEEGARVVAIGRNGDALAGLGVADTIEVDLTDREALASLEKQLPEDLDGVVNVAGVVAFGDLGQLDDDVLDRLFAVNATGPMRVVRAALPRLADGAFVANVTGIVAEQPMGGLTAYCASKAALSAATTALRRELRRAKVDVIDVRPPHTETGLADRAIAGTAPKLPSGADPDHVVGVILDGIRDGARELPSSAFAS